MKTSTKISISIGELRELITNRDPAVRDELLDVLNQVEQTSEAPDPDRYAESHSATRTIVDRLNRKAESMRRQAQRRRDRKNKAIAAAQSVADHSEDYESQLIYVTQSEISKVKQIMRRSESIRKSLLYLVEKIAKRTKSATLALLARSIDTALNFAGQIYAEIIYINSPGRVNRPVSVTLPTFRNLITA